ncbi:hypothetical protein Taro_049835 [Colocasia esculenta]|uniref:Uncharacterized protein n=1 Tax=Colocasia esculenta TaxID=4460 RepID=A0A843XBU3_COLES|nr:hypothetical protein [Colocasia esculenta]
MGLEEEAGHPSSGCQQQHRGVGEQKAPHPNRLGWPCLTTRIHPMKHSPAPEGKVMVEWRGCGVKDRGAEEVVELVEGSEQVDVEAWGYGLCLDRSPAAAAAAVVAVAGVAGVAGIAVGKAGTVDCHVGLSRHPEWARTGRSLGGHRVAVGNATPRPTPSQVSLSSSSGGRAWWHGRRLVWSGSGIVGARRRRPCIVKAPLGVVVATPGCSIPVVLLPADVATAERIATSEKASPWSDATLSRREGVAPGGGCAQVSDLEQKGKTVGQRSEPFVELSSLVWVSEVVQALVRGGPASPSHCLALCWFWSRIGRRESTADVQEGWTVCPSLSCLWRWLGCSCCDGVSHAIFEIGFLVTLAYMVVTFVLTWLLGVSCGDTWLFLPDLVEVRDVGACVMRLLSRWVRAEGLLPHCVALARPGLWLRVVLLPLVGVPAALPGRDSLSQEFVAGRSWWWLIRGWRRDLRGSLAGVREVASFPTGSECVAGCTCFERGCWFARAAFGFVVGLRIYVGVLRRLREPTCGVAFTGAGLWPLNGCLPTNGSNRSALCGIDQGRSACVRYRRSSSLSSSVGPFGSGPNREIPPHFWRRLWEAATAMARGRSLYQNVGSRMTRSRQSRADSRQHIPPVDVTVAPTGATGDVPAPAVSMPATALEIAELRGQMQHLTGICLGLQT